MKSELFNWQSTWLSPPALKTAELVLYFASANRIRTTSVFALLRQAYPTAHIIGCSTGGEIFDDEVFDDSVSGVAMSFDSSHFNVVTSEVSPGDVTQNGVTLGEQLNADDLKLVFVLSDGLSVNGTALVNGFKSVLPDNVLLTGGLAGDGPDFKETYVGFNSEPQPNRIVAIGFYGDSFCCRSGSAGGWSPFGPEREITRAENNVLYELDGLPALDLYRQYLGDEAKQLPSSALLYPLTIFSKDDTSQELVRTIIGINNDDNSMIFAGDIPQGYSAKLMSGSFNNLTDGAIHSAEQATSTAMHNGISLLVSCIGRKLLMNQLVSDEVEAVKDSLPDDTKVCGFYSYGEIAPHNTTGACQLHNQTMTITNIWES